MIPYDPATRYNVDLGNDMLTNSTISCPETVKYIQPALRIAMEMAWGISPVLSARWTI